MKLRSWLTYSLLLALLATGAVVFSHSRADAQAVGPVEETGRLELIDMQNAGPPTDLGAAEPADERVREPGQPQPMADSGAGLAVLGTEFVYQGRLIDSDEPAEGSYDFQFLLYDAEVGGSQVGSLVTKDDVQVTDGLFTVELDFGSNAFSGDPRYLEIGVRPGDSTGSYTILSPRRPVMPTPYAMYASNAGLLDGQDSSAFATSNHNHDDRYFRKRTGTQFTATLNAGQTRAWFTFGWPAEEVIYWAVHPTTEGGRVEWSVEIRRGADDEFTYYIFVTNVGSSATDIAARYVRFR